MTVQRLAGETETVGERQLGFIAATDQLARDGHVIEMSGMNIRNYLSNPIFLWSHDPEVPIGAAVRLAVQAHKIAGLMEFAPAGASEKADELCALSKAGIVNAVSIGFTPGDCEPIDQKRPYGGQRILTSELLEISLVAIPADTGARITARSFSARPGAAAMLRALPAVSSTSIARAMANVGRSSTPRVPLMSLSDFERTQRYAEAHVRRTMACWAVGFAREVEQRERYGFEQRQSDLAALRDR